MLYFLVKRLIVASLVVFTVIEVVPGDAASYMLGMNASDDTVAALKAELGLDQGRIARYFDWVSGMLRGDFGTSYTYRTPVADMVGERIMISLPLAIYALSLAIVLAFPAGILAASRRGGLIDSIVMAITQLGVAILGWSESADSAGCRTGIASSINSGSSFTLILARCSKRRLYAYRSCERADSTSSPVEARTTQRNDSGADHHRITVLVFTRRCDHH